MKLRIWDRIRSALLGLLVAALSAWAALYLIGVAPDWSGMFFSKAGVAWHRWAAVAVCVLLFLLGLSGVALLFRRRKVKGFVLQRTEYGDMSISMKAMENMVKKCVDAHNELTVNQTRIEHVHDGVCVDVKITLAGGVNIPLTVNALQKQIKQYITSCSGVDVHEVRVMVETDASIHLPSPSKTESAPVVTEPEPEPVKNVEEPEYIPAAAAIVDDPVEEPVAIVEDESEEVPQEVIELTEDECAEVQPDETEETTEEAQA